MPRVSAPLLLLAAALVTGAAAPSLRAADDADAAAKKLYRAKCSGCHRLHPKEELTPAEWKKRLDEMARRAKLTPEQLAILARYLGVPDEPAPEPTPTPAASHAPGR